MCVCAVGEAGGAQLAGVVEGCTWSIALESTSSVWPIESASRFRTIASCWRLSSRAASSAASFSSCVSGRGGGGALDPTGKEGGKLVVGVGGGGGGAESATVTVAT